MSSVPPPNVSRTDPAWLRYLTIDKIVHVLNTSVFHPFIAWTAVLCVGAAGQPLGSPAFVWPSAYAAALTLYSLLLELNRRLGHGPSRPVVLADEVVVVTGGADGLGQIIARIYAGKNTKTAVIDIKEPERAGDGPGDGIAYYKCDVGAPGKLSQTFTQIKADLGTPTILINNAGVMHGKSLLELEIDDIHRTIKTNLLSNFYSIKLCLPLMIENGRGTIVTVSSVIGRIGVAGLSDYAASKAGLVALHKSLQAEIAAMGAPISNNIRTILCTPGQLGTRMFGRVRTPSGFFAPVLSPTELANKIVSMVNLGDSGDISEPLYARWSPLMDIIPVSLARFARWLSGMDRAIADSRANPDMPPEHIPQAKATSVNYSYITGSITRRP